MLILSPICIRDMAFGLTQHSLNKRLGSRQFCFNLDRCRRVHLAALPCVFDSVCLCGREESWGGKSPLCYVACGAEELPAGSGKASRRGLSTKRRSDYRPLADARVVSHKFRICTFCRPKPLPASEQPGPQLILIRPSCTPALPSVSGHFDQPVPYKPQAPPLCECSIIGRKMSLISFLNSGY